MEQNWRSAAGALHAHIRAVSDLCGGKRGATVARAILAAIAALLACHATVDLSGSALEVCEDLGIAANPRCARDAVRLLSSLSRLIEVDRSGVRVRLRLGSEYRRAALQAASGRITAAIFAPDAAGETCPDGLFLAIQHHTGSTGPTSSFGPRIDARAHADSQVPVITTAQLLRELAAGRWIALAVRLLSEHPGVARGPVSTAMARSLLVAGGVSHGYREAGCLLRGLRYLLREGFLRADASGSVGLDSDRHPDLVVLGILAPPDARACSQETARYLRRRGVVAPEALGHHEAQALRRRLWWRASKELPTLPEVRIMLGFELQPADLDAYAEQVELADRSWSWGLGRQHTLTLDRASFSAQMRSGSTTTMHGWHDEPEDSRSAGTDEAVVTRDSAWGWAHYEADGAGPDEQPGDDERPDTHDEGDRGAGQSACADPRRGWHRGCWSRDAWHRAPGCSHADPVASPVCRAGVGKLPGTSGALVDTLSEGPFQAVRCAPIAALVPSGPCPVSRPSAARSARSRVFPSWWTPLVGSAA